MDNVLPDDFFVTGPLFPGDYAALEDTIKMLSTFMALTPDYLSLHLYALICLVSCYI